ncbi:OLC1v1003536C1 [Oldenlandia corymbosa var. corymbosa]|uniref:OLC1v1003536C1 n=1 Tax=Oldenlandia corymbosa var. corymbosa TaxID=529605 RepID=A0AAV1DC43_OLDCO|nr:OLC1v1003536C1 [Oldenlandia corymbosa var. corymbosa]
MASTLSVRPDRTILAGKPAASGGLQPRTTTTRRQFQLFSSSHLRVKNFDQPFLSLPANRRRRCSFDAPLAASRADDSAPFEMSMENALKVLGISEGASFEDIVRAKNSILSACKDDQETIAKVEAAYDTLLMQSLSQRRSGKVVSSSIRYADVKPVSPPRTRPMPQWLQNTVRNSPVSIETPSTGELGIQAGVYGALMVLTYVNGASTSVAAPYTGADVPGLLLATSFGASLYFITKKNVKLGEDISLRHYLLHDGCRCFHFIVFISFRAYFRRVNVIWCLFDNLLYRAYLFHCSTTFS